MFVHFNMPFSLITFPYFFVVFDIKKVFIFLLFVPLGTFIGAGPV